MDKTAAWKGVVNAMFYYLHYLSDTISFFRIFQYITVRIVAGAGTAFVLSLLLGPWIISRLHGLSSCDQTRYKQYLPALDALHGSEKRKTPTMGGILIILSIVISCLLWAITTNLLVWVALLTVCAMGTLGFVDDYIKTVKRNPNGLRVWVKLFFQMLWILAVMAMVMTLPETRDRVQELMVPFLKRPLISEMCIVGVFVFMALVFVGASNAVNLTDGLDGLAIGCMSSVALAFLIMSYVSGHVKLAQYLQIPYIPGSGELSVFCGCVLGASLGFLWFNCHPAQVFMGDTGSLALGGAMGIVAVLIKHELVLFIVGGVFVVEAMSVILQVGWFKLKGRRIFQCAPLHHHFELKKNPWSETQVTVRFWIVSVIFALIGILLLKIR